MKRIPLALAYIAGLGLTACLPQEQVTNAEMRAAVDDIVLTGQALSLENGVFEITTSFTIAQGVAAVLQEVREFAESQVACSTVDSPAQNTLRIDFGALDDDCTYNGNTFAGVVTVSFEVSGGEVDVTHTYEGLTNGVVTLDGRADVTWRSGQREVATDFQFTGTRGRRVELDSRRTQTLIGGLGDGIRIDGERNWHGASGHWNLDIDNVEVRGFDPVPQSGSYTLTNPNDKEISMGFERIDSDTIEITVIAGRHDLVFRVTSKGNVDDA